MEKKNEKAKQAQEQKIEAESLLEDVTKKKLEALSLELSHKVTLLVKDPELSVEVIGLIDEAINGTFPIGRAAGMKKEELQQMTDSLKETVSQFMSPLFVERVEKYKQLYHSQRMVSSHLISALHHEEIIGSIHESGSNLAVGLKPREESKPLDTTLAELGTMFVPVLEKAISCS